MKYIHLGCRELSKELFNPIKNRQFIKPFGGLWACEYTPDQENVSSWARWCNTENFYTGSVEYGIVFSLKEKARIFTVNDLKSLEYLFHSYPLDFHPYFPLLNYEIMSQDYDVIKLTESGEWATRFSMPYSLYGWDVESILVMNYDAIENQEVYEVTKDEEP